MEKQIIVEGKPLIVKEALSGYYYRLLSPEGDIVIDDPACDDFYGALNDVADFMSECIREDASKVISWWELMGAFYVVGDSEVSELTSNEEAQYIADNMKEVDPVTICHEFEEAKERLGFCTLEKVKEIYKFNIKGERGYVALYKDF